MPDMLNAAELRRLALDCAAKASDEECQPSERNRLLTIRESLLALAENADWLDGKLSRPAMQTALE